MEEFIRLKADYYGRTPNDFLGGIREGSDIVTHLPVLEKYARECSHITEFGLRCGHSTVAFLSGCQGIVHSYDIDATPISRYLTNIQLPCLWKFHREDTGSPNLVVEETDLLFFDTLHTYDHLKKELVHAHKARKYLAFHDTYACGEFDRSGVNPQARGILPAIQEFLRDNPLYETSHRTERNNGLWILRRLPA